MQKILIIDDQIDNITTIKAVIDQNIPNTLILSALSGKEGIEISKTEQPDTILLDIMMPEMDGYETCKILKELNETKHIPITILTAIKTDTKSRIKALEIGADSFISKPIDPIELSAQVKVMLRIKKAEDKLREENRLLQEKANSEALKLIESEEKYKTLFDNAPFPYQSLNEDGSFKQVNKSWLNSLGYRHEEVIGKFFKDFLHPDLKDTFKENFFIFLKRGNVSGIHFKLRHKKGHYMDVKFEGRVGYDENGTFKQTYCIFENITEKQQIKFQLESNEKILKQITNSSPNAIFVKNRDGKYLIVNKKMAELHGKTPDEIIGRYDYEIADRWFKKVDYNKFRAAEQAIIDNKEELLIEEEPFVYEDGSKRWFRTVKIPFSAGEDPNCILVLSTDITDRKEIENELKKSEQDYRGLFENAHDAILIFAGNDEIILDVNQRACDIYGFDRDEFIGKSLLDLTQNKIEGKENIKRTYKKGHFNEFETIQKTKDGRLINLEINASIIKFKGQQAILSINRDITGRKLAEAKLQEQAIFVNQNPAPVIRARHDGKIISTNKSALKISKSLRAGNSVFETFKALDKSLILNFKNSKYVQFEETIGAHTYLFAITKDKKTDSIYFFGSDISKRKNAEIAYKESAAKYKNLYTTSNDAIFLLRDEKLISCNPAAIKMYGYSANELMSLSPTKLSPKHQIGGTLSSVGNIQEMNSALKGKSKPYEWLSLKKDGTTFDTEILLKKITLNDGDYIHAIVKDISEKKRAELIQKALYNISNAVLTTDTLKSFIEIIKEEMGRIIDTTNFFIAFYDQETDLFSSPFLSDEIDNYDTWPAGKTFSSYVVKTSKSLFLTREMIYKMRDEGKIEIVGAIPEVGMIVPLNYKGETTGVFAIQNYSNPKAYTRADLDMLDFVSDQISLSIHRKKTDQDLKVALAQAKESDRLKSVFLATMSHELRTPLNAIIGFSDIIDASLPMEEILDYNKTINTSGTHLLSIVEDLFDITLIETGEIKIINETFDLNGVLKEIHEVLKIEQRNLAKSNIDLNLLAPDIGSEMMLLSDTHKLKQILINLLKNALKFTHHGHINYGYNFINKDGVKMLEFFVKDSGIGIPKNQVKVIFDVFRQVEDADTRSYGGTGIGLSISQKLVGLLGGKMWVKSQVGVGSQFFFTLPATHATAQNLMGHKGTILKNKNQTRTILIVEDDQASYEYLNVVLSAQEIITIWARDGQEAVNICKENDKIDLVLMDINMPKMNGFDATIKIKEFKPNLTIIAQTAYAISGDRQKSLDAGCDDYISKPIKKNTLYSLLDKYF